MKIRTVILFACSLVIAVILASYSSPVDFIIEDNTLFPPKNTEPKEWHKEKININTADKDLLMSIGGIGEKTADAILSYREENGGFKSLEEITNVHGIGQKTFDEIKNYICV